MSRVAERVGQTAETRLWLLESDLDRFDVALAEIRDEIKGLTRVMTGILISVATAAILLAVNIAIQSIG